MLAFFAAPYSYGVPHRQGFLLVEGQMLGIPWGFPMLNRLTVSALLKAVILATALIVIAGFSLRAWDSSERLQSANRVVRVADASAELFKAMSNLRSDRTTTARTLNAEQLDSDIEKYLRSLRGILMPALSRVLELLP